MAYIKNILVRRKKIEWIAENFVQTFHSDLRFTQLDTSKNENLKTRIKNTSLAWKTNGGCICIALTLYTYIVVNPNTTTKDGKHNATIITYVDTIKSGVTGVDKFVADYKKFNKNLGINKG